jgi:hypothetical protein
MLKIKNIAYEVVAQRCKRLVPFLCIRIQVLLCTPVIPAVPYMLTELAGYLVDPMISYGARKLARTPRVTKKKHIYIYIYNICFWLLKPWWVCDTNFNQIANLRALDCVYFPETGFHETIFQTFLCLFVIRKVG